MSSVIKYILIKNLTSLKTLLELSYINDPSINKEISEIFLKIKDDPNRKVGDRVKIQCFKGHYYCTISQSDIFYLILADSSFPERYIFDSIDSINKNIIINDNGELTQRSKKDIITEIEILRKKNTMNNIQSDVNDIRVAMNDNIREMVVNVEDTKSLENKANKIKVNADAFKKDAVKLKRITWWNNMRLTLIIIAAIIVLVLIIVLPIVLTTKHN
jgi:hypothetical protein